MSKINLAFIIPYIDVNSRELLLHLPPEETHIWMVQIRENKQILKKTQKNEIVGQTSVYLNQRKATSVPKERAKVIKLLLCLNVQRKVLKKEEFRT